MTERNFNARESSTNTLSKEYTEVAVQALISAKTFSIQVQTDVIPELVKLDDPSFAKKKLKVREMSMAGKDSEFYKQSREEIIQMRVKGSMANRFGASRDLHFEESKDLFMEPPTDNIRKSVSEISDN